MLASSLPINPEPVPQSTQQDDEYTVHSNRSALFITLFENQYQLVKGPKSFMFAAGILALLFAVLAIVTFLFAFQAQSLHVDYSQDMKCLSTNKTDLKCKSSFTVSQAIPGPVYLLYVVKNVYINHRRFINSYSPDQLEGKVISTDIATKKCGRFVYNNQIYKNMSWGGNSLNPNDIASLCGAKAQGYFNDTYSIFQNGSQVSIRENNIYKGRTILSHRAPQSQVNQWLDPQDQHLKLYWMDGSLMTKKRLWGVIDSGLEPGSYDLLANNNYKIGDMNMIKGIELTTANLMGGKTYFYCSAFTILCCMCLGMLIFLKINFGHFDNLVQHDITLQTGKSRQSQLKLEQIMRDQSLQ